MHRRLILVAGWLALVAGTVSWSALAERTPGRLPAAVLSWPTGTQMAMGEGPQALLFLHPRCPCYSKGGQDLARLRQECPELATRVVWVVPPGAPARWSDGLSQRVASSLPPFVDTDGNEARRFGVTASGTLLVFDASRRLVYSGGLTIRRSTQSTEGAHSSIGDALRNSQADQPPVCEVVFGCALFDEGDSAR